VIRPTPAPAAQAAAGDELPPGDAWLVAHTPDVWRVACDDGTIRRVRVWTIADPRVRYAAADGGIAHAWDSDCFDARATVMELARMERWPVVEILSPGTPSRAELAHRAEQGAVDSARIDRALATIDALTRERDRLAADLARLRATPGADLAAIEARAERFLADLSPDGHYTDGRRQVAASVGTLLRHITAHAAALDAARAEGRAAGLREAGDIARAEMALWADSLDRGSEVAAVRHRTASDIAAAVAALAPGGGR
jgi:hypothetical protein